jgi:hypothetical protein
MALIVLMGVTVRPLEAVVQPALLLPTQAVLWVFLRTWAFDGATRNSRIGSAANLVIAEAPLVTVLMSSNRHAKHHKPDFLKCDKFQSGL